MQALMRTRLILAAALLVLAACAKAQHAHPQVTIQQYMEGEVNPAGEFLFHSVQEISDEKGQRLKAPRTVAEWNAVRDQLAILQRVPEVLTAKGLKAAPPGFKAEKAALELTYVYP